MKLDKVLTIAIGRDNADGTLSDQEWSEFQDGLLMTVKHYATVVASTEGPGIASDDDRAMQPEDSAVVVAINPKYVNRLRSRISKLLIHYGQSSCAFALDSSHQPVFPNAGGARS